MSHVGYEATVRKRDVCVFAEGTRRRKRSEFNQTNVTLPLKKGAFHILKEIKYDLIIVKIIGGTRLMPTGYKGIKSGAFYV